MPVSGLSPDASLLPPKNARHRHPGTLPRFPIPKRYLPDNAQGEESKLFRFTLRHSVLLASVIGLVALVYTYVLPSLAP